MKRIHEGDFATAWGGVASISVALSVVWTGMRRRRFSLTDLARLMSQQPAQLAGLGGKKGRIAPGYDADFVVFNPDAERTATESQLHTRHALSPYLGERLSGTVTATYLRGTLVFENRSFAENAFGREIAS
jgi:allantoinase